MPKFIHIVSVRYTIVYKSDTLEANFIKNRWIYTKKIEVFTLNEVKGA